VGSQQALVLRNLERPFESANAAEDEEEEMESQHLAVIALSRRGKGAYMRPAL
jgi:hypothetical protein